MRANVPADEAFVDARPVVSEDAIVKQFAEFAVFTSVWDPPYGTPASETPWYQEEGYPIGTAVIRHTDLAIRDALGL